MRMEAKKLAADIVRTIELWRTMYAVSDEELHTILEAVAIHYEQKKEALR